MQLPPGDQSAYRRDRLKSGTPPPDRRLSWIPSGTVSKVLTVSTLAHLPCIAIWLGNELCVALCYLVGQVIGGICFRKGSVCVLGMSHSTLKLHYSHPCMDVQNPPFFLSCVNVFLICRGRMTYAAAAKHGGGKGGSGLMKAKNSKPEEIRKSNIQAAKALAEAVRTSLGPRYEQLNIRLTNSLGLNRCQWTNLLCVSGVWTR